MLEDVRRELQIERAAHHADFVLEDDEHARQSVMGPRHEVCWIWGDDIASEQDAALAGSGPDTAAAQQVSAPQAAVNALLSDPALPTDRLVLEVDIKTCTILAVSPGGVLLQANPHLETCGVRSLPALYTARTCQSCSVSWTGEGALRSKSACFIARNSSAGAGR